MNWFIIMYFVGSTLLQKEEVKPTVKEVIHKIEQTHLYDTTHKKLYRSRW